MQSKGSCGAWWTFLRIWSVPMWQQHTDSADLSPILHPRCSRHHVKKRLVCIAIWWHSRRPYMGIISNNKTLIWLCCSCNLARSHRGNWFTVTTSHALMCCLVNKSWRPSKRSRQSWSHQKKRQPYTRHQHHSGKKLERCKQKNTIFY